MTSHTEKLRETVSELEAELAELDSVDDDSRKILEEALGEILEKLVGEEPESESESESEEPLSERIASVAEEWEAKHPRLTNLLDRLIAGLSQLGI